MPLFQDYGRSEDNPGTPYIFGRDPDSGKDVILHIRSLPLDVEESYKKRYVRRKKNRTTGVVESFFDNRKDLEFLKDRICWMWVGAENLDISLKSEDAASFYRSEGYEVDSIPFTLSINGKVPDRVKRRLVSNFPALADFVVEKAMALREGEEEEGASMGED